MQSDWWRAFWPISQEPGFSQEWDLCKNTANYINFFYRRNSEKKQSLNFPIISVNPIFGPFLGQENFFLKKSISITYNTWASNTMLSFRKK